MIINLKTEHPKQPTPCCQPSPCLTVINGPLRRQPTSIMETIYCRTPGGSDPTSGCIVKQHLTWACRVQFQKGKSSDVVSLKRKGKEVNLLYMISQLYVSNRRVRAFSFVETLVMCISFATSRKQSFDYLNCFADFSLLYTRLSAALHESVKHVQQEFTFPCW